MVNKFIAPQIIPDTSSIGIFNRTYYISGEDRKQLWWTVKQRIALCQWCIDNNYTGVPQFDFQSFNTWKINSLPDPIYIFKNNLKLKQSNIVIDYPTILNYLNEIADRLSGKKPHKIDKTQYDNGRYCMKVLSGFDKEQKYMIYLYDF